MPQTTIVGLNTDNLEILPLPISDQVDSDGSERQTDFSSVESERTTASSNISSRATSPHAHSEADFQRWRPKYHLMAPRGWLNDPCAPGYDSRSRIYSLGFQWNPYDYKWGNMSWGSAVSTDFVKWTVSLVPAMEPTEDMDCCGVFTGCLLQNADTINGYESRTTVAFYTSAQKLPITYKQPYTRGSERLHLATSSDNGRSWIRSNNNIILSEPPIELGSTVRGWRDPFVAPWPTMDKLLGVDSGLYGIISGSIHDKTPTVFLYSIDKQDVTRWKSVGPIIDIPVNFRPSAWSGDFGVNWEVANFVELVDSDGIPHSILISSAEGVSQAAGAEQRSKLVSEHKQIWMCGSPAQTKDGIRMEFSFGGMFDHGCFYAANGFYDPVARQFVTLGWIFEEDLSPDLVAQQGWSGCLSIPRVVSMQVLRNVTGSLGTDIRKIGCVDVIEKEGVYMVKTLSISPDPRLTLLRHTELEVTRETSFVWFKEPMRRHWEFRGSFNVTGFEIVGLEIAHGENFESFTSILFSTVRETITVDRSRSSSTSGINTASEMANHTLFSFEDDSCESLDLHIFFDVSVLEIFVNERTVISTRVYPENGSCCGVRWITLNRDGQHSIQAGLIEGRFWSLGEAVNFGQE